MTGSAELQAVSNDIYTDIRQKVLKIMTASDKKKKMRQHILTDPQEGKVSIAAAQQQIREIGGNRIQVCFLSIYLLYQEGP